jgi:hypothetical protein
VAQRGQVGTVAGAGSGVKDVVAGDFGVGGEEEPRLCEVGEVEVLVKVAAFGHCVEEPIELLTCGGLLDPLELLRERSSGQDARQKPTTNKESQASCRR